MSAWKAKRFWKEVTIEAVAGGFTVRLDGRPVKTPAKTSLVVPTVALADAIAAEWNAQSGLVKPETMPFTRSANSALDKIVPQFDAVVEMLAAYGGTDLLCYRAIGPESLVARQAAGWDPLLGWASEALRVPLVATAGVMHIAQEPASLARLHAIVASFNPFELAAFHDLVAISGSLILALAVTRGRLSAEAAWALSRIDETWQIEQWGEDEEAAASEAVREADFLQAGRFYALCG
ncbi:ATPase [Gemmobacter aquarius]|uniref:ATPase n=1 Tax=Paragemmobacter aquarius TaxID=2169400 RepID=A0A2S0UI15_9RHOB|nr:ATP12 family protein [Gemmobacter aquarius]AWB47463.1 ATPase [Gemmobacter aquarius]